MNSWSGVRGKVWATPDHRGPNTWTWHYKVTRADGVTVLYDNTGAWEPMICDALIRVAALRHMVIAGHKLKGYKG